MAERAGRAKEGRAAKRRELPETAARRQEFPANRLKKSVFLSLSKIEKFCAEFCKIASQKARKLRKPSQTR
ncbi:hypothetical protein [Stappia indica]|uniref:hypothetical protein n=1 Tax=Stappia indica TaxID=538381 RepID=UPI001112BAD4|nr:hypothetical protein [Stappia indica]